MFTLNCKGRLLVGDKPLVMGIINATPDSFYGGSRFTGADAILKQAEQMLNDGAAILDVGGQSTRPGSKQLSAEEELQRILEPVQSLHAHFPEAVISVDTFYSIVARNAVEAGASIVNDVSAGNIDKEMIPTVAALGVPYVLMHMKGTPQTMQQDPDYENVTREILDFFAAKLVELQNSGITDVIIDPGFGFGKTIAHNFELLRSLSVFSIVQRPLMLGVSRKSTIFKTLGVAIEDALNGTTVLNTIALLHGAAILRVHDVKEATEAVKLVEAYKGISY
jgi:dihydropteroate synthase